MKILLHACCGPCSLEPVRLLVEQGHDITIAFMNSNIHPKAEYDHRFDTLLAWAKEQEIPVIEGIYDAKAWMQRAGAIQKAGREREARCRMCYRLRFEEAARYARENGFDALSTTLSVSPYQFTHVIEEELLLACEAEGIGCMFEDFRPFYRNATIRSREAGMYRQDYCGCVYSFKEAENERAERKAQREAEKAVHTAKRLEQERREAAARREKLARRAEYDRRQQAKRAMRNKVREQAKAERRAIVAAGDRETACRSAQ